MPDLGVIDKFSNELTVTEKRGFVVTSSIAGVDNCWILSPSPTVMHWGRTYDLELCCVDGVSYPDGSWWFLDGNDITMTLGRILGQGGDPCVRFRVFVPVNAATFRVLVSCIRPNPAREPCTRQVIIHCGGGPVQNPGGG